MVIPYVDGLFEVVAKQKILNIHRYETSYYQKKSAGLSYGSQKKLQNVFTIASRAFRHSAATIWTPYQSISAIVTLSLLLNVDWKHSFLIKPLLYTYRISAPTNRICYICRVINFLWLTYFTCICNISISSTALFQEWLIFLRVNQENKVMFFLNTHYISVG